MQRKMWAAAAALLMAGIVPAAEAPDSGERLIAHIMAGRMPEGAQRAFSEDDIRILDRLVFAHHDETGRLVYHDKVHDPDAGEVTRTWYDYAAYPHREEVVSLSAELFWERMRLLRLYHEKHGAFPDQASVDTAWLRAQVVE